LAKVVPVATSIVDVQTDRGVIELRSPRELNDPPKVFTFDAVYDPRCNKIISPTSRKKE
uniref:Kinesin motor domain-containing protein n=1 Tax=Gongylonema pulchrum TaxID=637853 RepID=A0A183DL82_9BILA